MQRHTLLTLAPLAMVVLLSGQLNAQYTNKTVKGKTKTATMTYKIDPQSREVVVGPQKGLYPDPYQVTGDEWIANQWSWLMWWETNAHRYLKPNRTLPTPIPEQAGEAFDLAHSTLLKLLHESKEPKLIQMAAYSLARMQAKDISSELVKLLDHADADVVRAAWLGLGIVDDELARHALESALVMPVENEEPKNTSLTKADDFDDEVRTGSTVSSPAVTAQSPGMADSQAPLPELHPKLTPKTVSAWIMAIGLSEHADESLLRSMVAFVSQNHHMIEQYTGMQLQAKESLPLTRLAMWAIRMHKPKGARLLCQQVLEKTTDIELFDEAVQTLASMPRDQDVGAVFTKLYHHGRREWKEFAKAFCRTDAIAYQSNFLVPAQPWMSLQTSAAVAFANPAIAKDARMSLLSRRVLSRTYTWVMPKFPNPADPVVLYRYDDWRNHGKPSGNNGLRFGIIALGQIGDAWINSNVEPRDGELLCEIFRGDFTDRMEQRCEAISWKLRASEHDPSRGFAAVAMGLYLRRLPADNQQIENEKLKELARRMERRLVETASKIEEPINLRCASILALGLSQTATAANSIKLVQAPDAMMASYATLALAMHNDPYTFELAHQAFEETDKQLDVEQLKANAFTKDYHIKAVIMQRNIIHALACMAEPQANQMLLPRFLENAHTSRTMLKAFNWSGDSSMSASIVELMQKSEDNLALRLYGAWALGELHESKTVPVMTEKLLRNRNITIQTYMKSNKRLTPTREYLQMIDPFVYKVLLHGPRG